MAKSGGKTFLPCGRPKPCSAAKLPTLAQLEVWKTQLRDHLFGKGLKYTAQRWKIAEMILSSGEHLDAQGIVTRVKTQHPEIGAATVYRSIKVLCDASILKESLTDANGRVIYELFNDDHHDHIICTECSEIFEFHDEKIENQQNSVTTQMNFSPIRHRHVIYAKCNFIKRRSA